MPAPACATSGLPPETWDASVHGEGLKARDRRVADAVAVCAGCPIRTPCGQLADQRFDIGVWGGTLRRWTAARVPLITHDDVA